MAKYVFNTESLVNSKISQAYIDKTESFKSIQDIQTNIEEVVNEYVEQSIHDLTTEININLEGLRDQIQEYLDENDNKYFV